MLEVLEVELKVLGLEVDFLVRLEVGLAVGLLVGQEVGLEVGLLV